MLQTTINGKAVTDVAQLHALWAKHLDTCERFETKRPIASKSTRAKLEGLADKLNGELSAVWDSRKDNAFATKVALNRYVKLEEELGSMAGEAPVRESFHVRNAPWAPDETRLDGDADELQASADEAEADAIALRFELHRVRKSTANRVSLAKLGLVPRFSWSAAWADTKARMRELGAEIRSNEAWVRSVHRELITREREHEAQFNSGVVECDPDYDLPAEMPTWSYADYREMGR